MAQGRRGLHRRLPRLVIEGERKEAAVAGAVAGSRFEHLEQARFSQGFLGKYMRVSDNLPSFVFLSSRQVICSS